jgi:SNF2 family DNA or RNA helicase
LAAALIGTMEPAGEAVEFRPDPVLADLADRLRHSGEAAEQAPVPAGLLATLRPYQPRGLGWWASMCETGLGGCLADDVGLRKTVQNIALHLHRMALHCGPTLVVCPTSLLGN